MKGQGEVVAIVLILMIVVALAALAYTWLSGMFSSLIGIAGTAVEATTGQMQVQFKLESATCIDYDDGGGGGPDGDCLDGGATPDRFQFTIRNTGQRMFDPTATAAYVDNILETGTVSYVNYQPVACAADNFFNGCTVTASMNGPYTDISPACVPLQSVLKVTIQTGLSETMVITCI